MDTNLAPAPASTPPRPNRRAGLRAEWHYLSESAWDTVEHSTSHPWRFPLLILWIIGILGDAATTLLMMYFGFTEQNPIVRAAMGTTGEITYITLVTLLLLIFPFLATAPPRTPLGYVVVGASALVCIIKLWTAFANVSYWVSHS